MENKKYLVRPNDFHVFDLDETNNCYRSYTTRGVTYVDDTRPNAQPHFTYKNLTENYDFFPIDDNELDFYESKHKDYREYINWRGRPDGHGGSKGGSMTEYLEYIKNK